MYLSVEDEILLLREQVTYLLERVAEQPSLTERAVNWAALSSDEAAEHWALLVDWTDWLLDRYQLEEWLPGCWYAHGPLLEEVSALRTPWIGAYLDPQARLDEPARWHELLDRTLDRIGTWDRAGCRDGSHRPDQPAPDLTDHSHRERAIHADLTSRDQTPPPTHPPPKNGNLHDPNHRHSPRRGQPSRRPQHRGRPPGPP